MLALKQYQQRCLDELSAYLTQVHASGDPDTTFYQQKKRTYQPFIGDPSSPFVCFKVPTGGGKTLLASHSVVRAFDQYLTERDQCGLVLWLVPSDAILTQTLKNLRDRRHPYREVLDHAFDSRVIIMEKNEALAIKPSDISDNICIVVTTLASIRRENTEGLKVYAQNGALMEHFRRLRSSEHLIKEGTTVVQSLANVIRLHRPLVILDEGHNAQTELSIEILKNLLPSCILEYTATPDSLSNILIEVLAVELKLEEMVKIPINLKNVASWRSAVEESKEKRDALEKLAKKEEATRGGAYIRPILLLQTEMEQEKEGKVHVKKIIEFLTENLKVPREQIAIKTGKEDELAAHDDILSPHCPLRYIVTCNALKEGWDCSFAYVLVSASNVGTSRFVEQVIGRILRLPYTKRRKTDELNESYVYTSSRRFNEAAKKVEQALVGQGYSKQDIKRADEDYEPPYQAKRLATDEEIALPVLLLHGEPLEFRDLIPEEFTLEKPKNMTVFLQDLETRRTKIDITEEGVKRLEEQSEKLAHLFRMENEQTLVQWLSHRVQEEPIAFADVVKFTGGIVTALLKTHTLKALYASKFALMNLLGQKVKEQLNEEAERQFRKALKKGDVTASRKDGWRCPDVLTLLHPEEARLKRHLFDRYDALNEAEREDVAKPLSEHPEVVWWFRNPAKGEGLFIQGYHPTRFFPDFIARTKNGAWWILEYKGEQLVGSADSDYKEEIGKFWSEICGKKFHFHMVTEANAKTVLEKMCK
ncbi:MAG: type III restriction protein res subunit [Candidatus Peregrinibacteria bacterium Greene0416_19]|nr:MAG: type III restriction protein res subunit [Candidatus Peregrinibacteria bacterium Greene0416_19]